MNVVDVVVRLVRRVMKQVALRLNKVTRGSLHPNAVTIAGLVMHLPIAFLIAYGKLEVAGVLLIIFGLFDALDGELARLQQRASEFGMFLDATADRMKQVLLYGGIAYFISMSEQRAWTVAVLIACGASLTFDFIKAKAEVVLVLKQKTLSHSQVNRYYKEGLIPFEVRMFILVVGLLSGRILWATVLIAVLATYTVFERLNFIGRKL